MKPVIEQNRPGKFEELVTEVTPGHYISWKCGNYGYNDDGTPLPKGYRLVRRYLSGNFIFFCKGSVYNYMHGTYDARHNTMSAAEFRQYIEDLRQKYNQFCNILKEEAHPDLPHRFASYIGERERQQKQLTNVEHTNAILAAAKLRSVFEDWAENSLGDFDFSTLCKKQTDFGGKLAYHVEFFINRPMGVVELGNQINNKRFLYTNGRIFNEREAEKLKLDKYALYSAESAKKFIADCLLYILEKYDDRAEVDADCDAFDFFSIVVRRISPPTHLFTKAEIEKVMREGDDSINNVLVIDGDGVAKVIPSTEDCHFYPVHHETWVAYNNYVGKYSKLSTLDDDYRGSLKGWLSHLETGENVYVDYVYEDKTEDALITEILKFYPNELTEGADNK